MFFIMNFYSIDSTEQLMISASRCNVYIVRVECNKTIKIKGRFSREGRLSSFSGQRLLKKGQSNKTAICS